jgi:hypothetical protein
LKPLAKFGVDHSKWKLRGSDVVDALLAVPALPPVLPFRVWQTPERWEKKCFVATWKMATTDREVLARWWRVWPDARVGIPIAGSGLCVIDVDDPADKAFAKCWQGPPIDGVQTRYRGREPGYSLERTPSGGYHVIFAMCDPPIVGKIQWSPSVEVIGERFLFVCHDLRALALAKREVLPEVFRQKTTGGKCVLPRTIIREVHRISAVSADGGDVEVYTAALLAMNPADWIPEPGEEEASYAEWFGFVSGTKAVGISRDVFVEWQTRVPRYADDGAEIERIWDSARGEHGGKFFQALSERGIKLSFRPTRAASDPYNSPGQHLMAELNSDGEIEGEPYKPKEEDWRQRRRGWIAKLVQLPTRDLFFWVACRHWDLVKAGVVTEERARKLLRECCEKVSKQIDVEELSRIINNARRTVMGEENDGS